MHILTSWDLVKMKVLILRVGLKVCIPSKLSGDTFSGLHFECQRAWILQADFLGSSHTQLLLINCHLHGIMESLCASIFLPMQWRPYEVLSVKGIPCKHYRILVFLHAGKGEGMKVWHGAGVRVLAVL